LKEKKKVFLKLPEFPGGKVELVKYIRENLQYPELARINRIEGIVYLSAEINGEGEVIDVMINKPIGYGCDEEATRLVSSLKFGKVRNRGKKVKIIKKFSIEFKLPENISLQYNISTTTGNIPTQKSKTSYTYNLDINRD
jgi:TonB family protein